MERSVRVWFSVYNIGCEICECENDPRGRRRVIACWNRQLVRNPWLRTKFPRGRLDTAQETPLADIDGAVYLYLKFPGSLSVIERELRARKLCVKYNRDYDEIVSRIINNANSVIEGTGIEIGNETDDETDDDYIVSKHERAVVESLSSGLQLGMSHLSLGTSRLSLKSFRNAEEYESFMNRMLEIETKLYDHELKLCDARRVAAETEKSVQETKIHATELQLKWHESESVAEHIAASEHDNRSRKRKTPPK